MRRRYRVQTKRRRVHKRRTRRVKKQHGGSPKVIMSHIAKFQESESHPGVYYNVDESDITKGTVMIVGPRYPGQNTSDIRSAKYPYEECLFFFNIGYPATYPSVSPHMAFLNSAIGENIRFHPNLYQQFAGDAKSSGKVCLSILGTWTGPGWSPTMNIESTLSTVQSIIGADPVHNEPGFEGLLPTDPRLVSYNFNALYHSINFTLNVFLMVLEKDPESLPPPIDGFVDEIKERMWYSIKFLIVKLKRTIDTVGIIVRTQQTIHHPPNEYAFSLLLDKAIHIYKLITPDLKKPYNPGDPSINVEANTMEAEHILNPPPPAGAAGIPNASKRNNNNNNNSNNNNNNNSNKGNTEYEYSSEPEFYND
jgi:ubiquitin-protein ligase